MKIKVHFLIFFFISISYGQTELKSAYFASGCFWCVESIYESLEGVNDVESGYSGGWLKNPTYRQVLTGKTGHAESIKVSYNPNQISFSKLVEVFFASHDPTTLNKQGPDIGTHYRSIAFYENKEERIIIEKEIKRLLDNKIYDLIVTEVRNFEKFYLAERYHQDYKIKNPNNPYIWNVSVPRIEKFKSNYSDLLKKDWFLIKFS